MKRFLFITAIMLSFAVSAFAVYGDVTADINSYYPLTNGPNMPFPQFINYTAGGQKTIYTLSDTDHQPDGVTHAEMEKWVSDGWQIYLNSWGRAGTTSVNYQLANGTNVNVPLYLDSSILFDGDHGVSEGHGYGLLMAAIMGDKKAFDGLWFWINENELFYNTKKYSTGNQVFTAGKQGFGIHAPSWAGVGSDTATDGDVDIAMGALIAWKQWGDDTGYYALGGTGNLNSNNLPAIQYKQMALDSIRFLVAKAPGDDVTQPYDKLTGDIGFDGYMKGGNTMYENSGAFLSPPPTGPNDGPYGWTQGPAPEKYFYDYCGPAYFRCFGSALEANGNTIDTVADGGWNVNQFKRAAASMFWVQGKFNDAYPYPSASGYRVNGANVSFETGVNGTDPASEDMRSIWRHTLDYMLYGNPPASDTWNPNTLTVDGSTDNHSEYNAAMKFYNFYKGYPCLSSSAVGGTLYPLEFGIPEYLCDAYKLDGTPSFQQYIIPKTLGGATSAAIIGANESGDFLFMERWFRQLCTVWDNQTNGDGYLTSEPKYFHDFFRMLGLVMVTGNYVDACNFVPQANMKIYKAVDKTYAFTGDVLTYHLNYRNYGSVDATGVYITDTLPSDLEFISSTPSPSSSSGNTYRWGPFNVTGLHNQNLGATMGGITLVARIKDTAPNGRICNTASISAANGTGWTSNQFPNEVSYTMKRNCVDIVSGALTLTKTASAFLVNPEDTVTYTIDFCNSSKAGWLDGGRSGVIFSVAEGSNSTAQSKIVLLRGMHSASEPWIDWGNYRTVYYVDSATNTTNGWVLNQYYKQGTASITNSVESVMAGCAAGKCWNQRMMFQNAPGSITMPTHLLLKFYNNAPNMHFPDGIIDINRMSPLYLGYQIQNSAYTAEDWNNDYSQLNINSPYSQIDPTAGMSSSLLFPVGPDWTAGDHTSVPVPRVNRDSCNGQGPEINNILIEEWDGYCWRRVYGNGPAPGRDLTNVVLYDSLPNGVSFGGFLSSTHTGTYDSGTRTLQWNVGKMLVNECGQVSYWVTAEGTCPMATVTAKNMAYIKADKEAAVTDSKTLSITCSYVPPPPPPPSSITKTANASSYNTGDGITYTIAYTNFNGTYVDSVSNTAVLQSSAGWTKDSGSDFSFGASGIVFPNAVGKYHYNYSHGINGTIYFSAHMTASSAFAGISFRNGYYLIFKSVSAGQDITPSLWNGTSKLLTGSFNSVSPDLDFKVELTGDVINVFIKDQSALNYPVSPTMTYSGIAQAAGYVGIIEGDPAGTQPWGGMTLTKWQTSMDTAFDVHVYDPVPGGITYGGASDSGILTGGSVDWGSIAMLTNGQGFTYNWYGTVTGTCMTLANTAYAQPMGVTYTVGDQVLVTVNCGVTTPTNSPTLTATSTLTATGTSTTTATATLTATPSLTATASSTATLTATTTVTVTPSPTSTDTNMSTATLTSTSTLTSTPSSSSTLTATPSVSPSSTFTQTPTFTITQTETTIIISATITLTWTNSPTMTATPTATVTITSTNTSTDTETATSTFTNTATDTPTETYTYTYTATSTDTPTSTATHTYTASDTVTGTPPPTFTFTETFTHSNTMTYTDTATNTHTRTFTNTFTETFTYTQTSTFTDTFTATNTRTPSFTATNTNTFTNTFTHTATFTATFTSTHTNTPGPTPVELEMELKAWGETPGVGAKITYQIVIRNPHAADTWNVNIWDSLPAGTRFVSASTPSPYSYSLDGDVISWDFAGVSLNAQCYPGTPSCVDEITVEFTVEITQMPADRVFENTASADYNDYAYPNYPKHPIIDTGVEYYPGGMPVIYPNPFNPKKAKDGRLKIDNVPPGSVIQIYTVAGENVISIQAENIIAYWYGKNKYGNDVSPGLYYITIHNKANGKVQRAKLFVVNN